MPERKRISWTSDRSPGRGGVPLRKSTRVRSMAEGPPMLPPPPRMSVGRGDGLKIKFTTKNSRKKTVPQKSTNRPNSQTPRTDNRKQNTGNRKPETESSTAESFESLEEFSSDFSSDSQDSDFMSQRNKTRSNVSTKSRLGSKFYSHYKREILDSIARRKFLNTSAAHAKPGRPKKVSTTSMEASITYPSLSAALAAAAAKAAASAAAESIEDESPSTPVRDPPDPGRRKRGRPRKRLLPAHSSVSHTPVFASDHNILRTFGSPVRVPAIRPRGRPKSKPARVERLQPPPQFESVCNTPPLASFFGSGPSAGTRHGGRYARAPSEPTLPGNNHVNDDDSDDDDVIIVGYTEPKRRNRESTSDWEPNDEGSGAMPTAEHDLDATIEGDQVQHPPLSQQPVPQPLSPILSGDTSGRLPRGRRKQTRQKSVPLPKPQETERTVTPEVVPPQPPTLLASPRRLPPIGRRGKFKKKSKTVPLSKRQEEMQAAPTEVVRPPLVIFLSPKRLPPIGGKRDRGKQAELLTGKEVARSKKRYSELSLLRIDAEKFTQQKTTRDRRRRDDVPIPKKRIEEVAKPLEVSAGAQRKEKQARKIWPTAGSKKRPRSKQSPVQEPIVIVPICELSNNSVADEEGPQSKKTRLDPETTPTKNTNNHSFSVDYPASQSPASSDVIRNPSPHAGPPSNEVIRDQVSKDVIRSPTPRNIMCMFTVDDVMRNPESHTVLQSPTIDVVTNSDFDFNRISSTPYSAIKQRLPQRKTPRKPNSTKRVLPLSDLDEMDDIVARSPTIITSTPMKGSLSPIPSAYEDIKPHNLDRKTNVFASSGMQFGQQIFGRHDQEEPEFRDDERRKGMSEQEVEALVDLQQRLGTLSDPDKLRKVVQIIEESGKYRMEDTTFDFDLCSLDSVTIKKLRECLQWVWIWNLDRQRWAGHLTHRG